VRGAGAAVVGKMRGNLPASGVVVVLLWGGNHVVWSPVAELLHNVVCLVPPVLWWGQCVRMWRHHARKACVQWCSGE